MANEKPTTPKPAAAPKVDAPTEPEGRSAERVAGEPAGRRVPAGIDQPAPEPGQPSGYHPPAPPFMSEGVRNDLEQYGETTDPNTGQRLTRADLG
jgi:hypothetical protein